MFLPQNAGKDETKNIHLYFDKNDCFFHDLYFPADRFHGHHRETAMMELEIIDFK